jgi:hypothetical protein
MRKLWIDSLLKISLPVLDLASKNQLKDKMPSSKNSEQQYLEAIARTICGISPWLNLPDDASKEAILRTDIKSKVKDTLANIVEPKSSDYIDFGQDKQSLVDAAYLAQGLIRCPSLYDELPLKTQKQLIEEFIKTRKFIPAQTNWLLFAAMIETFLFTINVEIDNSRLVTAINNFINLYYIGDGIYGDGLHFHFDYYNSFVIHPMLTDILEVVKDSELGDLQKYYSIQILRHQRYSEILERLISPTGTWPPIGRTLSCRIGVFYALSHAVYKKLLTDELKPAQVRCALNAVLQTFLKNEKNFSNNGFLTIGLDGEQQSIAEDYISIGSSYHAMTFFVALGLPEDDEFWKSPDMNWTSLSVFSGADVKLDHSYDENISAKTIFPKFLKLFLGLIKNKINMGKTR